MKRGGVRGKHTKMSESQLQDGVNAVGKAWFTQLNARERSTLAATFAGWMLDGMDAMVFGFVLPTLIALWHISKGEAGLLGTSALLLSSLGGWLAGLAADRFGRVKVLQLTILWFAVFTFLSGFTTNFAQLLVLRGLQGLGFGGEWAVGAVLIGETIRKEYRGRAVGTVQGGWAIGWGISALFYTLFFAVLPSHLAWRAMFWIGLLPALLAVWIRRHVSESDAFSRLLATKKEAAPADFFRIFSPSSAKDDRARLAGCVGRTGWLLRDQHLAASLFEWPRALCDSHGRIPARGDIGIVLRISFGGASDRPNRPQMDSHSLCGSFICNGTALYGAGDQR